MAYSEKVVDHYENPRNVGSFEKGDDTGPVARLGRALRLGWLGTL